MKDIDVLKHTSVDHLPLTGGTLTGDLTINGSFLSINIEDSSGTGHAPKIVTKTISEA